MCLSSIKYKTLVAKNRPFGMAENGRKFTQGSSKYLYGFNGKENDKDITSGDYDFGNRFLDSRLGRWFSTDFYMKSYPGITPYGFVGNNPITKIDIMGDYEVKANSDAKTKKQKTAQENSLNKIGKAYTKYLNGLEKGSKELNTLLTHSGFDNKEDLIAAWLKKGNGAVTLTFSTNEGDNGPKSHQTIDGSNFAHPDGSGGLAGSMAIYGGNAITYSKTLFGLSEYMANGSYVQKADKAADFNYAADAAAANLYIARITSHEVTHWGRDRKGWSPGIEDGLSPDLRPFDVAFDNPAVQYIYEAGQHWEYSAFQKRVSFNDVQYGFAVNVYYRCLAKSGCSLQKAPDGSNLRPGPSQISSINAGIKNYIIRNYNDVFQWTNKTNTGTFTMPEPIH